MVISVSHLTDQVEITGGGHARILSAARGPAFPPARAPTPVAASDSCTLTPLRGYDDPFQFHLVAGLTVFSPGCYSRNSRRGSSVVEQPIRNRQVVGSTPTLGSSIFPVLKRLPFSIHPLGPIRCKVVASFD